MIATGQPVDRAGVVERERRREATFSGLLVLTVAALVVVRFDPLDPDDVSAVAVCGAIVLAYALGVAGWMWWGVRQGRTDRYRCLHAISRGTDPGPGLRERTRKIARQTATERWAAWLQPLIFAPQLLLGHWRHLVVTVPAAIVFATGLAVLTWRQQRRGAAAKRWLDDPPVPADERDWLFR